MSASGVHACGCATCRSSTPHPDQLRHQQINLLISRLDEQQRRWYVALESMKVGYGGDRLLSRITGMDVETIRRGRREMEGSLRGRPTDRVRLPGAGRPPVEKKSRTSPPR